MAKFVVGLKSDVSNETADAALDDKLVARCREVWSANESRDLEARYELGKLLNGRLGSPGKRLKYGAAVVKKVADDLGIKRPDLTRSRQFAHQFSSFEDFRKREPNCTNWTRVKQALVKPTTKKGASRVTDVNASVEDLRRRVRDVTAILERKEVLLAGSIDNEFAAELKALIEVAGRFIPSEPQSS